MPAGSRGIAAAALVALVALAAPAGARPASYREVKRADALFVQGRALAARGDYAAACAAFAKSHTLDPQFGTLYNLAGCHAKRGMLVAALAAYRDLARHDRNAKRRADSERRAHALERRIPRVRIVTTPGVRWTVRLNGIDVSAAVDRPHPVDPGRYELVATAAGEIAFRTTLELAADGKTTEVVLRRRSLPAVVDPFAAKQARFPVIAARPRPPDPARRARRRNAMLAMGGGGAFVAVGLVLGKLAIDRWQDAKAVCGGDLACATAEDTARADELADRARAPAHGATALILGGAALAGLGAWLYWTPPADARLRVTPGAAGAPGVTLGGTF